ncbi:MAG: hypothetical protein WDO15_09655 [Bacteroidota bacterium]
MAITYSTLSKIMSGRKDFKRALEYAALYKTFADSATNLETQRTSVALESRYQHQKRQKEIVALTAANVEHELDRVKEEPVIDWRINILHFNYCCSRAFILQQQAAA